MLKYLIVMSHALVELQSHVCLNYSHTTPFGQIKEVILNFMTATSTLKHKSLGPMPMDVDAISKGRGKGKGKGKGKARSKSQGVEGHTSSTTSGQSYSDKTGTSGTSQIVCH